MAHNNEGSADALLLHEAMAQNNEGSAGALLPHEAMATAAGWKLGLVVACLSLSMIISLCRINIGSQVWMSPAPEHLALARFADNAAAIIQAMASCEKLNCSTSMAML